MSSHRHLFVFLLGMYDRITESLGMFSCSRYCQTYFQRGYSNLKSSSCPISSPTLDTMCLFHFSDSGSVQWSLHGGLNLYSSMTSQVAHCLVYLLTTWISSCELPFQVLPIFPFSCLFLIDLQELFIYSKDSFFCQREIEINGERREEVQVFSLTLWLPFLRSWNYFFLWTEVLDIIQVTDFFLLLKHFVTCLKNLSWSPGCLLIFSSKSFIIWCFTFRSAIHLGWIFVYGLRLGQD